MWGIDANLQQSSRLHKFGVRSSMTKSDSEDQTIANAIEGSEAALTSLLKQFGPSVRQNISSSIPRRWQAVLAADDVMQQAYTDAFMAIGRFVPRGKGAFGAWLNTLAKRNLIDAIRGLEADKRGGDRQQIGGAGQAESFVALYERLGGTYTSPSSQAARQEARLSLEEAIERLPETYRHLIRLYDLESRPIKEVAETLNRSPGAVFMLRSRAHRKLCDIMGTASKYMGDSS